MGVKFRQTKIVSDVRVFDVIDSVKKRLTGNWVFTFNTPVEILKVLAEQIPFGLRAGNESAAEKLDRILAARALAAFNEPLMQRLVNDIQGQSIRISDADDLEDAVALFTPRTMRFAGKAAASVFHAFMEHAARLDHQLPNVFGPSKVPGMYTSRRSLEQEMNPRWQDQIEQTNKLAVATFQSWAAFVDLVRDRWPDLILSLHE